MIDSHAVGIDLGTTTSAVAYVTPAGRTAMLRNERGELLTPSVVFFDRHNIVVGHDAQKALLYAADSVIECIKRELGNNFTRQTIQGKQLPTSAVQAYLLEALNEEINAQLGGTCRTAITVPAFFDDRRRAKTLEAASIAGLDVLDIVNEPTAAALAFGQDLGYLAPSGAPKYDMNLLVYDLGGGTFDVTAIRVSAGDIQTLATDGDARLGGRDWDARLVDYVSDQFEKQFCVDPRDEHQTVAKLRRFCEEAKHTLSARNRATVSVHHAGDHMDVSITREIFQDLTEDLLERTLLTIRKVSEEAQLPFSKVDRVLLVGGSTRMPAVPQALEQLTGMVPDQTLNPDEAVARGAAIYAACQMAKSSQAMAPLKCRVVDVAAHSLGVEGIDTITNRRQNTILIPRNTPLPTTVIYRFVTRSDDQESAVIQVVEGESSNPHDCVRVGKVVLRKLPPDLEQGTLIEVTFHCESNGRLDVSARMLGTDRDVNAVFQRSDTMSRQRVQIWQRVLSSEFKKKAFNEVLEELYGPDTDQASENGS